MNGPTLYTHRLSGRRPMTFFGFGVFVVMIVMGISDAAPWYFMAPVGVAGVMLIWLIFENPQSGSDLTSETLTFFHRKNRTAISIADIASMKVTRWTDGPDTVMLRLKSGDVVHVPSMCADSKLAVALKDAGILEVGA